METVWQRIRNAFDEYFMRLLPLGILFSVPNAIWIYFRPVLPAQLPSHLTTCASQHRTHLFRSEFHSSY